MMNPFASAHKSLWRDTLPEALPLKLSGNTPLLILTTNAEEAHHQRASWQLMAPHLNIAVFPDWEILPYEHFSPHKDLISERLSVLWKIQNQQIDVLIMSVAMAMQKLPPCRWIASRTFFLKTGSQIHLESLRRNLVEGGYNAVGNVISPGEFSVRGGLIDLFPVGSQTPYRLDLWDDEIDSIKTFDPDSQRTLESIHEICLLPAHEFPTEDAAISTFCRRFREELPNDSIIYKLVSSREFGSGVEFYLPLFFEEECVAIVDYFHQKPNVVYLADIEKTAQDFYRHVQQRYTMAIGDPTHPPLEPRFLYFNPEHLQAAFRDCPRLQITPTDAAAMKLPTVAVDRTREHAAAALQSFILGFGGKILLCAQSAGRRETMVSFLRREGIKIDFTSSWDDFVHHKNACCSATISDIARGFHTQIDGEKIAVISENDLYPSSVKSTVRRRRHTPKSSEYALRDLAEIRIGDLVVHEMHGIGRYLGLMLMNFGDFEEEMMVLEYAGGDKFYVPVSGLNVISRYAGMASESVELNRLGNASWSKAKQKAAQKAHDTAAELLHLYALREAQKGFSFIPDEESYRAFADGFEYQETEDQSAAIVAVIGDLINEKPMDRLVCGDVGFGKTEVALRAAFVVAMSGKQVALLAPTTLLVEQHAQVFRERFANFPIKVASLSRFRAGKETREVLMGLENGTVDIVIGTHKLIQPDVKFAQLGLVIIDEEHRFGVRQKEALKQLRSNVDLLTLTATPIPRTLSMALEGLRDFSLIATAPEKRLSVKTFVRPYSDGGVIEAVTRELKRAGQVFFLHNDVQTIENMREKLQSLLPDARIAVAHGQMPAHELEQIMRQFMQQQFNVLLCSTIIETGIDIPNANTIIINRADRFGIAQLHQLRGRVGRSHHQAYAYLLTPESLGRDAQKRLEAIAEADELGAGFMLAMQDLEIRGAGELLGEGQSGAISQVGLSLFGEMLKQAVRDLKNGKIPNPDTPLSIEAEIKLHYPARLPEEYCPDVHERLMLYKRLSACTTIDEVDRIYEELIDRFGMLPNPTEEDTPHPVRVLLESHRLRIRANDLGISSIDATEDAIDLVLNAHHQLDMNKLIALIQSARHYRLINSNRLRAYVAATNWTTRINNVLNLLQQLSKSDI